MLKYETDFERDPELARVLFFIKQITSQLIGNSQVANHAFLLMKITLIKTNHKIILINEETIGVI